MKKILIVDDCKEIRQLVSTTLDLHKFSVREASNGVDAITIAQKEVPDLIIMDIIMPGLIDGNEAIRTIKSRPETARCKIIILSGSRSDIKKDGSTTGADDIITKPFSPLELISKVEHILDVAS